MLYPFSTLFAQVGINTNGSVPDGSAMLDVKSSTKGMLLPRMTVTQRNAIASPATGLLVFCTDNNQFYSNVGTPASPNWTMVMSQWITSGSHIYYNSGNVGIGWTDPHAPIQLSNQLGNRKIVLFEDGNNDHQYYGFGVNGSTLRYQVNSTADRHVFYAGNGSSSSVELMRIQGDGRVGIGTSNPLANLQINVAGTNAYAGLCINSLQTSGKSLTINQGLPGKINFTEPGVVDLVTMNFVNKNVGINNTEPASSALVDMTSTTKGFLPPRMTTVQRNDITTPSAGLIIYNNSTGMINYFSGSRWLNLDGTLADNWVCGQPVTDSRDLKVYATVLIGTQCWMAQNLNIGTLIFPTANQTNNSIIEKYCYNNIESYCDIYGGLYQWEEAMQYVATAGVQGICPAGWHLPTDAEWTILTNYLGGEAVAGGKMKESGTTHWLLPNIGATNTSAFTALTGGFQYNNGFFVNLAYNAYFWSSSQDGPADAWCRVISYYYAYVGRDTSHKSDGFSGRCLKD